MFEETMGMKIERFYEGAERPSNWTDLSYAEIGEGKRWDIFVEGLVYQMRDADKQEVRFVITRTDD
jgi:hypothetical protein